MTTNFNKIPVSDKLNDTVNKSLSMIDKECNKGIIRKMIIGFSATAAAFVGVLIFAASNPVLASKIPVIGRIFANIEEDITFSGDYSNKAEVLTAEDSVTTEPNNLTYSVSDKGYTITASEVYCDGYSIYLTLNLDSKKSLGEISAYHTSSYGNTTAQFLYTDGTYSIDNFGENIQLQNNHIQGKQMSDNSFIGMIKLDTRNMIGIENSFNLHLNLNGIGADTKESMEKQPNDSIEPIMTEGTWELDIPVSINNENVKTYKVAEQNDEGFGISQVIVTPYQILVESIAPTVSDYADLTEEEFKVLYGEKNKEIIAEGKEPVKYGDLVAMQTTEEYGVAIFDQNGDRIEVEQRDGMIDMYSIKGRDIQKIYLYISRDSIRAMKETNQKEMEEYAVFKTEMVLSKEEE